MEFPDSECVRVFESMSLVKLAATLQAGQVILTKRLSQGTFTPNIVGGESGESFSEMETSYSESGDNSEGGDGGPSRKKKKKLLKGEVDLDALKWVVTQPCNQISKTDPPQPLCAKCPKVYSGSAIANKCPLSVPILLNPTPAYSCLNNKIMVYGFWCSHPKCKRPDGGPSLIKIGQTGNGLNGDRVGQQLEQVRTCTIPTDFDKKEVARHFHQHWLEDNKSCDPYQFVHFSIIQQLTPDKGEDDRLSIERALILRFHTNHPDFGVNGQLPNPLATRTKKLSSSSSSSSVAYKTNRPKSIRTERKRAVPFKVMVAIALKQDPDFYQASSTEITTFIQLNFPDYGMEVRNMAKILRLNGDQSYDSNNHVAEEDKTNWFVTVKKGKGGSGGGSTYGFSLPRWPATNAELTSWLHDEETIANLNTIAKEGLNLDEMLT